MDMDNAVIAAARQTLEAEYSSCSQALKSFPRGPMGLTLDAVKASKEYKAAKHASDAAFASLRRFNSQFKPPVR